MTTTNGLAPHLADAPIEAFAALGDRLREIGAASAHEALVAHGREAPIELRRPIRIWHARRIEGPAGVALGLLALGDHAPVGAARDALGARPYDALRDAGALIEDGAGEVAARALLSFVDGLALISDPLHAGADAVMGPGATTIGLGRAATPTQRVGSALDVGCGAGSLALHLARHADRVVGVDVNPRAVAIARRNAALNRLDRVEFRVSDLFSAVAGERFDRIASQPPFVARAGGTADATWLHGGARGDEIALRLLHDLPAALGPRGRAFVLLQLVRDGEGSPVDHARAALGRDELSVVSFEPAELSLDEYATQYALAEHPDLDAAYGAASVRLRDHLDALGARAVTTALLVVSADAEPLYARVPLSSPQLTRLEGAKLEARLLGEQLRAAGAGALRTATLRLAEGLRFERTIEARGAETKLVVDHARSPLVERAILTLPTDALLRAIHAAPNVDAALREIARRFKMPESEAPARLLPIVDGALRQGLLVPEP